MDDLCYLSAAEALRRYRAKKLSPVEHLEALIKRAECLEPSINAFAFTYFDEALEQARAAEAAYHGSATPRPLEGIALAVKDESFIQNKITTNGSLLLKDQVADHTSPVLQRLMDAGAIVHARTTAPEFSCSGTTHSKLFGVSRNPWNLECSCGGSTGGGGAALAAGTTTLSSGSDNAGSIRMPAAFNGVVGFKPSFGRNPSDPPFNLDPCCQVGPLARTVEDAVIMQNLMSGPHPQDIMTLKPKLRLPTECGDLRGWRIAYSMDLGYKIIDPEVERNTLAALDVFRQLGAAVDEVEVGWSPEVLEARMAQLFRAAPGVVMVETYNGLPEEAKALMTPYARSVAEKAAAYGHTPLRLYGKEHEMHLRLSGIFADYQLLVCPTLATSFIAADSDHALDKVRINGQLVNPMLGWSLTYPFNLVNRCPVISLPSGRAANNVPTGIQLVGPSYEDGVVIEAAMAYQAANKEAFVGASNHPELDQPPEPVKVRSLGGIGR